MGCAFVFISNNHKTVQLFRFIDSAQHLSAPLDTLIKNLTHHGNDHLTHLTDFIETEYDGCEEKLALLSRKGVYPYSYVSSLEKFSEGS